MFVKFQKGNTMKKFLIMLPVLAVLTACSSTPSDFYEKRSYNNTLAQARINEKAIDQAPKWMLSLPKSNTAVYENGSAVSPDMSMAVQKAKLVAYGKICMAAGGRVDQQSKMFRTDTETNSTELSETAARSICPSVDITGVEMVETKLIAEGARFRAFVLVALPTGEANQLARDREDRVLRRQTQTRSGQAFRELDSNAAIRKE
jgi:hypothetical protein